MYVHPIGLLLQHRVPPWYQGLTAITFISGKLIGLVLERYNVYYNALPYI